MSEHHKPVTSEEIMRTFDEDSGPPIDLRSYAMEDWLAYGLFWLMGGAVILQFFTRYVLNDSLAWTEEIATNCLVALVFIGSAMCVRLDRHIGVDFLFRYLAPRPARMLATAIDIVRIVFFAYVGLLVWHYMQIVDDEEMTTVKLPKNLVYAGVLLGFVFMFVRSCLVAIRNWRQGYSALERPDAFDAPVVTEA